MRDISSMQQELNLKSLKSLFQRSADVIFQEYLFQQHKVHLIKCEGMMDERLLQTVIVQRVQSLFAGKSEELLEEHIQINLQIPHLQRITSKDDAMTRVYKGHVLLYFENLNLLYSSYIAKTKSGA